MLTLQPIINYASINEVQNHYLLVHLTKFTWSHLKSMIQKSKSQWAEQNFHVETNNPTLVSLRPNLHPL